MLSADPTIPEPGNLQAYSRYAYVFNDPINRWDPSGYKPNKWWKLAAGLAIAAFAPQLLLENFGAYASQVGMSLETTKLAFAASNYTIASQVAAGAVSGFAGALVSTGGDFKSAAAGALTGGMFGFAGALGAAGNVSGQMAMHAAAGCVSGALGGGGAEGCARGAVAQSFSKMVTIETKDFFKGNVVAHGVIASVSGGTASAMMGGKFANGAMTGAFGYVLNQMNPYKALVHGLKTQIYGPASAGTVGDQQMAADLEKAAIALTLQRTDRAAAGTVKFLTSDLFDYGGMIFGNTLPGKIVLGLGVVGDLADSALFGNSSGLWGSAAGAAAGKTSPLLRAVPDSVSSRAEAAVGFGIEKAIERGHPPNPRCSIVMKPGTC